jgi:hypothetical protein
MTDRDPAAPGAAADDADHGADAQARRASMDPLFGVRTADIEPYLGLRYLSKLFRLIALILVLLLVAEVVTGLAQQGTEAIPTLVAEASRLIVLAALLWGIGDLVLLLIDVGHDVRAARILIGRQVSHLHAHEPAPAAPRLEPRADARAEPVTVGEEVGARTPPGERRS